MIGNKYVSIQNYELYNIVMGTIAVCKNYVRVYLYDAND